ncbi:epithelial cell-transforming sequence 2 oncogene-like [Megalops cyprinoides]|uniref:epithelial cell-transforming sequence 2 oncogene-like n=1 Tax=Megalops cyprinoides TaxID=118141 RepID=UPI00186416A4|nr:epithelial cell-transforming sequence 2 oncogene-like [Megalops cyprinoides]
MTALEADLLRSRGRASPHSVKLWQLNGTDFQPAVTEGSLVATETRFSTWTPIGNKPSNQQLFQERMTLISHWFDLWTDRQRKQFIHSILTRCSKSQLNFTRDWFLEVVPIMHLDFTTVLPRFLSLYILSFLNPQDLCSAAQVSWHWKFLAEQDCLWSPKCVIRGWFLPYTPADGEFGAWKRHYVACASSLDYLTPREAEEVYGTLNEPLGDAEEEEEERRRERWIRQAIREKVAEHKRLALKGRRPWLSSSWSAGTPGVKGQGSRTGGAGLTAALVLLGERSRSQPSLSRLLEREARCCSAQDSTLQKTRVTSALRSLPRGRSMTGGSYLMANYRSQSTEQHSAPYCQSPLHLLLVSSRVPAYELVLSGVRVGVVPLLYDHSGTTLQALLFRAEGALRGQRVQSVGVLAEGDAGELSLTQGCRVTEESLLSPDVREFWEKLSGWVVPRTEGGRLDIFAPLAASVSGMELLSKLSTLTGLNVTAPTGIATGSYQHILSDWLGQGVSPPQVYFSEAPLLSWCRQAEWLEEALRGLRVQLGPQLLQLRQETRGRALGQFLWDEVGLSEVVQSEVTRALAEGLAALSRERCDSPLSFLCDFLRRRCEEGNGAQTDSTFRQPLSYTDPRTALSPISNLPQAAGSFSDRRLAVAGALLHSERVYVRLLQAVARVYSDPLRAALNSNRAVLSSAHVLMVFSPVLDILEVNSPFLAELTERLGEWGPSQCLGDVLLKFCSKLRTYTNFFNNYPTILRTIDKCREMIPAFRAFLRRHDRTLATSMLSLQELLLLPASRVEEYATLLEALLLHTPPQHPDQLQLRSALDSLQRYKSFLHKLKQTADGDSRIAETQRMIHSCPNLQEGNRHLMAVQEVELLHTPHEDIAASLRVYERVGDLGLFLFNDALVLSERSLSHLPYRHTCVTSHTFLASVALHTLTPRDIADTKYVQNAFALEGPKRQWVCATEREEDKVTWLSALRSAINAAIGDD